jgi:hypothetical protein
MKADEAKAIFFVGFSAVYLATCPVFWIRLILFVCGVSNALLLALIWTDPKD